MADIEYICQRINEIHNIDVTYIENEDTYMISCNCGLYTYIIDKKIESVGKVIECIHKDIEKKNRKLRDST